ncbi:GNAT family N-acetyltransferase [Castellaniella hirudinis]|uniref:GNAT family N-acetyltransferase n=1 Tax=Castellaniella hirudinis TaxID=1144617 RepID=UPI0039C332EB
MSADYRVRSMRPDEIGFAIQLAAAQGWNPGLHDAAAFQVADPGGFFVGELDGAPIGCISAVRYGADHGFIGLYIMQPEHRSKGYGRVLWDAALSHLAARSIGLDGVPEQQDNYRKSGFVLAHQNIRYEYKPAPGRPASADDGVTPLEQLPAEAVQDYDGRCFAAPRAGFLAAWCAQPGTVALAWCNPNGALGGFGAIRPCRIGWKIGPLFADDPAVAQRLMDALASQPGVSGPVYLDVPEINLQAVRLAADRRMRSCFSTARMYRGTAPAIDFGRVYGVTSFELG